MRSSFWRSFYPFVAILLVALILVGFFFLHLSEKFLERQTESDMKNNCAAVARVASAYADSTGLTDRNFLINLSVSAQISQANIVILDENGVVLTCSDAPLGCEHQGLAVTGSGFLEAVKKQDYVFYDGLLQGLYDESRFIVATGIYSGQNRDLCGVVLLSMPASRAMVVLDSLTDHYLMVSVAVILLATVLVTLFARKNTTPLRDMAKAATAFGHGDFSARARVPKNAPEEIRELALSFNNMAVSLEKSEEQRQDFVANVSHELKTPMTTIAGYVDGILDGTIPESQQDKYLKIVSDETKRLNRLVRSMLDISQLQDQDSPEEKKSRCVLQECAGQVLITFEQKILGKQLDVQVDFPEMDVYTLACRDYITQVIYNLVDNSVKFCPQGGQLGLRICTGGNKIYFTVSNTGEPIPPEELPLLFDRFHKVDRSRSRNRDSWGLGLYIVKTIICSHGEDISVSSTNGRTEFTFTLPLVN